VCTISSAMAFHQARRDSTTSRRSPGWPCRVKPLQEVCPRCPRCVVAEVCPTETHDTPRTPRAHLLKRARPTSDTSHEAVMTHTPKGTPRPHLGHLTTPHTSHKAVTTHLGHFDHISVTTHLGHFDHISVTTNLGHFDHISVTTNLGHASAPTHLGQDTPQPRYHHRPPARGGEGGGATRCTCANSS